VAAVAPVVRPVRQDPRGHLHPPSQRGDVDDEREQRVDGIVPRRRRPAAVAVVQGEEALGARRGWVAVLGRCTQGWKCFHLLEKRVCL
jgi:hypothetical protein